MPADSDLSRPLEVLIIGAGIGGLAAASALKQQGHNVKIFEKSRFNKELGAAITIPPNINRILKRIGLKAEDHGMVVQEYLNFNSAEGQLELDVPTAQGPVLPGLIHRVDLHNGLRDTAFAHGVEINLDAAVQQVDTANGVITFADGSSTKGDAVIAADGVHSSVRGFVLERECSAVPFGVSTFRALVPSKIVEDTSAKRFIERPGVLTLFKDTKGRLLVVYPCRGGTLVNVVALFSEKLARPDPKDPDLKGKLLSIFGEFHEDAKALLALADEMVLWRLLDVPVLEKWTRGRTTLLGDAAHPILPYAAQGGAQAIEDAITIAILLPLGTTPEEVPSRLRMYHAIRHERVEMVQEFSRSLGRPTPDGYGKPAVTMMEFFAKVTEHDAVEHAKTALRDGVGK